MNMAKLHRSKTSLQAYMISSYRCKISVLHTAKHGCVKFTGVDINQTEGEPGQSATHSEVARIAAILSTCSRFQAFQLAVSQVGLHKDNRPLHQHYWLCWRVLQSSWRWLPPETQGGPEWLQDILKSLIFFPFMIRLTQVFNSLQPSLPLLLRKPFQLSSLICCVGISYCDAEL